MDTSGILTLSLRLAKMEPVPADTAIVRPCEEVTKMLVGIDIDEEDLNHAKEIGCDLVMAHHPLDKTGIVEVLKRQERFLVDAGVAAPHAREAGGEIIGRFQRNMDSMDHQEHLRRMMALADELHLGLMNVHSPCDELGRLILQRQADELGPKGTVSALIDMYSSLPEIKQAGEGVELICGTPESRLGRTFVFHAAGTNGGYPAANALFDVGMGTVVYIHLFAEEDRSLLRSENKGNLITTGHYGSDSLGINPLLDRLEEAGIEIICCNDMIRG
jgi:hypothetical protein